MRRGGARARRGAAQRAARRGAAYAYICAERTVVLRARGAEVACVAICACGARDRPLAVNVGIRGRCLARQWVVALPKEQLLSEARLDGACERNGRHPVAGENYEEPFDAARSLRLGGTLDARRVDEGGEVARLRARLGVLFVRLDAVSVGNGPQTYEPAVVALRWRQHRAHGAHDNVVVCVGLHISEQLRLLLAGRFEKCRDLLPLRLGQCGETQFP